MRPAPEIGGTRLAAAFQSLNRAAGRVLGMQTREGCWQADLTADSTLESDWLLLRLWLDPPRDGVWNPPGRARIERAAASILARQQSDGGFPIYPGGPSEVSASVKAYCALKLAGVAADGEALVRLRQCILALGGVQAANSFVKINLSLFNLYPRQHVPRVPPELALGGKLLYQMAAWTRAILAPLAIVQALVGAGRPAPDGFTLEELFKPGAPLDSHGGRSFFSWDSFFFRVDGALKWWERHGSRSLRTKAVHAAGKWMLARFEHCAGPGAIYPSLLYSIMALDLLGYGPESAQRAQAERRFEGLLVDAPGQFRIQPGNAVVRDTALALAALGEAGAATPETVAGASRWLLGREVRRKGDWSIKRPQAQPGGWPFESANEFNPGIDDTALVLLGLAQARAAGAPGVEEAGQRAIEWLLAMQSKDGGWAAFDADNDWEPLNHVPLAGYGAMLDPTCPDITGRVLQALARWGVEPDQRGVQRGLRYLLKTQERDGSWYGRWGVDYIYGTFQALGGLRAAGYDDREAEVLRAGEWLRSIQNADGGWGESCASYDLRSFVAAPSAPTQTGWAVLGLLAGGDTTSESVRRGIEYLVATQREDGGWDEALATGTSFPRAFYLLNHLDRDVFPLLALANYYKLAAAGDERR